MSKYLIFLVGLLAGSTASATCSDFSNSSECRAQRSAEWASEYRAEQQQRAAEQAASERTRPITVIEPHGVTTLYPSMDGSTYQSYSIGRRGQD